MKNFAKEGEGRRNIIFNLIKKLFGCRPRLHNDVGKAERSEISGMQAGTNNCNSQD